MMIMICNSIHGRLRKTDDDDDDNDEFMIKTSRQNQIFC